MGLGRERTWRLPRSDRGTPFKFQDTPPLHLLDRPPVHRQAVLGQHLHNGTTC